jgi:hypothetical protein
MDLNGFAEIKIHLNPSNPPPEQRGKLCYPCANSYVYTVVLKGAHPSTLFATMWSYYLLFNKLAVYDVVNLQLK